MVTKRRICLFQKERIDFKKKRDGGLKAQTIRAIMLSVLKQKNERGGKIKPSGIREN